MSKALVALPVALFVMKRTKVSSLSLVFFFIPEAID
jgi:hypothetical protein